MPPRAAKTRSPSSPGAKRQRRYRERRAAGVMMVTIPLHEADRDLLLSKGVLEGWCMEDSAAVANAVRKLLDHIVLVHQADPEEASIMDDPTRNASPLIDREHVSSTNRR